MVCFKETSWENWAVAGAGGSSTRQPVKWILTA